MTLMVRETVEETRLLTLEEQCACDFLDNCDLNIYKDAYIDAIKHKLYDEIGFASFTDPMPEDNHEYLSTGRFEKSIKRVATHAERNAYYYMKIVQEDCCDATIEECDVCPFADKCICSDFIRDKCRAILEGKEFFEE